MKSRIRENIIRWVETVHVMVMVMVIVTMVTYPRTAETEAFEKANVVTGKEGRTKKNNLRESPNDKRLLHLVDTPAVAVAVAVVVVSATVAAEADVEVGPRTAKKGVD